jgi:organic hydroperoxide reductase OsmC/OhrA
VSEHRIALDWTKGEAPFTYDAYPRNHRVTFKNRDTVIFSAAAVYKGDPAKADPEDGFVAALSSCHMLSFLAIAAKKKLVVESYEDDASGFLENDGGTLWMTRVILRPKVAIAADAATVAEIHHLAHKACFIANSVKTDVRVEPR